MVKPCVTQNNELLSHWLLFESKPWLRDYWVREPSFCPSILPCAFHSGESPIGPFCRRAQFWCSSACGSETFSIPHRLCGAQSEGSLSLGDLSEQSFFSPNFSVCSDNQLHEDLVDPKFFHMSMMETAELSTTINKAGFFFCLAPALSLSSSGPSFDLELLIFSLGCAMSCKASFRQVHLIHLIQHRWTVMKM